jgi:two-component system, LytTR family, sensor histidine kinase LytS
MEKKIPNLYNVIPILKNRILLHIAFWAIVLFVIFVVPVIPMSIQTYIAVMSLDIIILVSLTYTVTTLLIPHLFYSSRYVLFFASGISLCLFLSWMSYTVNKTFFTALIEKYTDINLLSWLDSFPINTLFFFLVTALKLVKDLMIIQYQAEQDQKQKMTQELSFLRSQLSPHFLLNTMNNLYGLSVLKSDDLPRLLLRFSDLLRYSIYDTKSNLVSVRSELKYLNDFIELQKMRLSDKVNLNIDIADVTCDKGIVPMVLVVFVENAFKHSQDIQESSKRFINIRIWIEGEYLHFISENNCGTPASLNSDLSHELNTFKIKNEGIGLETTIRRLELLYGKDDLPTIDKRDGKYKVMLKLKCSELNENN